MVIFLRGLQSGKRSGDGIRPNDAMRRKILSHAFLPAFSSSKAARKAGRCKIPQAALNRQKLGQHCYCRGKRRENEGEDEGE